MIVKGKKNALKDKIKQFLFIRNHGRNVSRTPEKSRSRSGDRGGNEENNGRYESRSPRSGSERD